MKNLCQAGFDGVQIESVGPDIEYILDGSSGLLVFPNVPPILAHNVPDFCFVLAGSRFCDSGYFGRRFQIVSSIVGVVLTICLGVRGCGLCLVCCEVAFKLAWVLKNLGACGASENWARGCMGIFMPTEFGWGRKCLATCLACIS